MDAEFCDWRRSTCPPSHAANLQPREEDLASFGFVDGFVLRSTTQPGRISEGSLVESFERALEAAEDSQQASRIVASPCMVRVSGLKQALNHLAEHPSTGEGPLPGYVRRGDRRRSRERPEDPLL
jgi:hypothetical protein